MPLARKPWFRAWRAMKNSLSGKTTSEDLAQQATMLEPAGTRIDSDDAIGFEQRRHDEEVIIKITNDWKDLETSFYACDSKLVIRAMTRRISLWRADITEDEILRSLGEIGQNLQRFLDLHKQEIAEISSRDYRSSSADKFDQNMRADQKKNFGNVLETIQNIRSTIARMIELAENQKLYDKRGFIDEKAARILNSAVDDIIRYFTNYSNALNGILNMIRGR